MSFENSDDAGSGLGRVNYLHKLVAAGKAVVIAAVVFLSGAGFALSHANVLPGLTVAMPDHGKSDCVSFKPGQDTNPLNYAFGYACVSEYYCEVFDHGCGGESCQWVDPGKGTRTTMTEVSLPTPVNQVLMASSGISLKQQRGQWCLVQDGAGHFWALDKWRGSTEQFSLENLEETVVRCQLTDYFSSQTGCEAR